MFHVRLCQQHDPRHGEQWFGGVSVAQLDACPTQGSSWLGSQQPAPCTLAGAAGTRLRRPRAQGTTTALPRLQPHLSLAVISGSQTHRRLPAYISPELLARNLTQPQMAAGASVGRVLKTRAQI